MDDALITLPCGFVTTYGSLKNAEKVIRCMMCEDEDINVEEILNRPGNRLRVKEEEIKIEIENLKKMSNRISMLKKDPKFYVEKSFERIFNELDLRKEIIKKEFEQKLDDYFTQTRDDLVQRKETIIQELVKSLAECDKNLTVRAKNFNNSNCTKIKDKLKLIETELNKIFDKKKKLDKIISKSEYGESLKLSHENNPIEMQNLFGEIRYAKFDFKEDFVLNEVFNSIWKIKQVDEKRFLSGYFNTIKLWDIDETESIKQFTGHDSTISNLCILNKDHFASCSVDKTIKIWNLINGECIKTLTGHDYEVWDLKLLSNGQLASSSDDQTIKLWNYETAICVKTLTGHTEGVVCIEEWNNNTIISGSSDTTIKIWNIVTNENIKTLNGHTDAIYCLKLIDSNRLASGSCDKTIKIWNLEKAECLSTLEGHTDIVYDLGLFKSGHLVSCSEDGTLRFWDINLNQCLQIINEADNLAITGMLLTQDENIVTASNEESLKFWNLD